MKAEFENYITSIISSTFGFVPKVEVIELPNKMMNIIVDGSPMQRAEIMGREAKNFQSIKMLLRAFSRKRGYYSYFYLKADASNSA